MSEQRPDEGDWGQTELDAQERADADLNLDDPEASDDEPWSPPDRQPRGAEAAEIDGEETLNQRILQEEHDPNADAPEAERRLGGDDPDSIPADQDFLGDDGEVGDEPAGDLVAPDEGLGPDVDSEVDATERGLGEGPEQDAVHIVQDS
ncbi:MAG: DUF5709 domain-containing protein [Nocardioides sp.]